MVYKCVYLYQYKTVNLEGINVGVSEILRFAPLDDNYEGSKW